MKRVGEPAIRQGTRKRKSGGNLLRREPLKKMKKWRELPSEGTAEEIKMLNEQFLSKLMH
jgi:hypothetical protein